MLKLLFGDSARTYKVHMVIQADNDRANMVRDVYGEFSSDTETPQEAQNRILAECRDQLGADVFMVSFRYQ